MGFSIDFDGNDLTDYGLVVTSPGASLYGQQVPRIQLQDRGYAFRPVREPRRITINVDIIGTSRSNLDSNLDNIRRILTQLTVRQLKFDVLNDRYYNAILERFRGDYISAIMWRGRIDFVCPDPVAYSITETSSDQNVDADPKTLYEPSDVAEVIGGSAFLLPVYTFTAGESLTSITLLIKNETTIEELSIASLTMADSEVLVIDCATWLVTLEGVAEMANVTGKFPRLEPNLRNQFTVTNFGSLGTLNITYKVAYL